MVAKRTSSIQNKLSINVDEKIKIVFNKLLLHVFMGVLGMVGCPI